MKAKEAVEQGIEIVQALVQSEAFKEAKDKVREAAEWVADGERVPGVLGGMAGIVAALLTDPAEAYAEPAEQSSDDEKSVLDQEEKPPSSKDLDAERVEVEAVAAVRDIQSDDDVSPLEGEPPDGVVDAPPGATTQTENLAATRESIAAKRPAAKKPAAKTPAAKKSAAKKPAAKKPAAKKPAAKKPAAKTPAAKKPAAKTPAAKKPAAKTPAAKTPAAKKPAAKRPAAKKPAAKKPAAKKPAAKKSAAKKPAAKKPAAKKPAAKKPAARKPAAKKPAARKNRPATAVQRRPVAPARKRTVRKKAPTKK